MWINVLKNKWFIRLTINNNIRKKERHNYERKGERTNEYEWTPHIQVVESKHVWRNFSLTKTPDTYKKILPINWMK